MSKLIILIGPPASGKSTWREKFLASQTDEWVVCSTDDLLDKWAAERGLTYDEAFGQAPWSQFNKTFKYAWRTAINDGKNVIIDRTSMSSKSRKDYLKNLPVGVEAEAVVFVVDDVELRRRLDDRAAKTGKSIPDFVIKSMNARYETPSKEEGFTKITYVRS